MTTEKEKMFAGQWFDPFADNELNAGRDKAFALCHDINALPTHSEKRAELLAELFPNLAKNVAIINPVWADYGTYTTIGENSFVNRNAFFMDGAGITIGKNCLIGPNCGMYTANHPLDFVERRTGHEIGLPIVIEDDVWVGGDVTITPGVTIGHGSVIGAKSLVNKNIPPNVVAVGNPCHVLRKITAQDKVLDGKNS